MDSIHSTGKVAGSTGAALRLAALSVAAGVAMAVSAVAGAWMQSQFDTVPSDKALAEQVVADQARRDADQIRETVAQLAAKVGEMQAQLIAMEALASRVAEVSGVSATDPEVHALLEHSGASLGKVPPEAASGVKTAEALGRELDDMARALAAGTDRLELLDAVLTRRTGLKETLPTLMPVDEAYESSSYGWRRHPITGRHTMHEGLDFPAARGTPILAASGGVVTEARYVPGYGKMVEISHGNGLVTRYAHASSISVKPGDLVNKGQQIARVGSTGRSTGSHLHFEVRIAGHALDPKLFLENAQAPVGISGAEPASKLAAVVPGGSVSRGSP